MRRTSRTKRCRMGMLSSCWPICLRSCRGRGWPGPPQTHPATSQQTPQPPTPVPSLLPLPGVPHPLLQLLTTQRKLQHQDWWSCGVKQRMTDSTWWMCLTDTLLSPGSPDQKVEERCCSQFCMDPFLDDHSTSSGLAVPTVTSSRCIRWCLLDGISVCLSVDLMVPLSVFLST